jgi:hypothetical protein
MEKKRQTYNDYMLEIHAARVRIAIWKSDRIAFREQEGT